MRVRIEEDRFELSARFIFRRTLYVTRETAWIEAWHRRIPMGRRPVVGTGGWDWDELNVMPSQPELRLGLHDDSRVVMAEWNFEDEARSRDAEWIAEIANAEIERLHGKPGS